MAQPVLSDAGMRIAKLLVGNPPLTMAELIEAAGVTRTAVTEQLNELVTAGLVKREVERTPGRGRPRHRYQATEQAMMLLFVDQSRLVVPALWEAIRDVGGEQLTRKVLKRVSKTMADHYKRLIKGRTPRARLRQLIKVLQEEGGLIELEANGKKGLRIHKRSCQFLSMFEPSRSICAVDRESLSLVVGAKLKQVASRHDGHPCCTFELARNGKR